MKKIRANAKGDCGDKKKMCGQVTRELVPPGHEGRETVKQGKFIDLWRLKEGTWKITRVLGYGHRAK